MNDMSMLFFLLLLLCFYWYKSVSNRLKVCEELLKQLQTPIRPPLPPPLPETRLEHVNSTLKAAKAYKLPRLQIPGIIRENWMGVFGSLALVAGAVFFGLT